MSQTALKLTAPALGDSTILPKALASQSATPGTPKPLSSRGKEMGLRLTLYLAATMPFASQIPVEEAPT